MKTEVLDSTKLWYLKRINLLRSIPMPDLGYIAERSKMEKHAKGKILYFQGDAASEIFFLKEGRVKLSRLTPEGRELTLSILEKGEIFGELSAVGEEKRNTQAQVLEEALLCTIDKSDFLYILGKNPSLTLNLTKFIGFRRRRIESKLEELIFRDVPTRLSGLLLSLKEQYGNSHPRGTRLEIALSHQELANLIGATRETVSACLARWKKEGLIDSERRKLVLLQAKKLEELAALRSGS